MKQKEILLHHIQRKGDGCELRAEQCFICQVRKECAANFRSKEGPTIRYERALKLYLKKFGKDTDLLEVLI